MTEQDFIYWLQGYFELYGTLSKEPAPLPGEAQDCIRKHIQLVNNATPGKQPSAFVARIYGMLEVGEGDRLSIAIQNALAEKFKHDIDPKYPNSNQLNQIHNSGPSTNVSYRC